MTGPRRPSWCQDQECRSVAADPGAQIGGPEASGFCCGLVPEPLVVERKGYRHENDGHLCFRSALRGVVMLEVNGTDLENVASCALRGLVARDPGRSFGWRWFTGRKEDGGEG